MTEPLAHVDQTDDDQVPIFCRSCGRRIEQQGTTGDGLPRWASRFGRGWLFTCSADVIDDPPRVLSARYHSIEGESPRYFFAVGESSRLSSSNWRLDTTPEQVDG